MTSPSFGVTIRIMIENKDDEKIENKDAEKMMLMIEMMAWTLW